VRRRVPRGLAAWAERWADWLATEADEAAAAAEEDGIPVTGLGSRTGEQAAAVAAEGAAAALAAGAGREAAAVWQLARALGELGRFGVVVAARGERLRDGSVLAEVRAGAVYVCVSE
jgi:hypothetical protein